jgi:hypothetical protein
MSREYYRRISVPAVAALMVFVFVLLARSSGPALCPRIVLTPDKPDVSGFELSEASRYPSHVAVRSADGLKMFSQAPFELDLSGFKGKVLELSLEARALAALRNPPVLRITCPNGMTRIITIESDKFCKYNIDIGAMGFRCKLRIEYINDTPLAGGGMDLEIKSIAVSEQKVQ